MYSVLINLNQIMLFSVDTKCDVEAPKFTNMPSVDLSNVSTGQSQSRLQKVLNVSIIR